MSRCKHSRALLALTRRVQRCLSPDLLREGEGGKHPHAGHCAVASEAVWAAQARDLGYKTRMAVWTERGERRTHWWLVSPAGCVLDPTSAQFSPAKLKRIYAKGRGAGPQGVRYRDGQLVPSTRARLVLTRATETARRRPRV